MGLNLSGTWIYSEDYSHGDCEGELVLTQEGKLLSGILVHREIPVEGNSFKIQQELEGYFNTENSSIVLKATTSKVVAAVDEMTYELDSFIAQVLSENLIVGTSEDEQGVLGVFTFKRS